MNQTVE